MQDFTSWTNISIKNKNLHQNYTNSKIFEINSLIEYLIECSYETLKKTYRPTKYYTINDEVIKQYHSKQINLNPYLQVIKIIELSKKKIEELKILDVFEDDNYIIKKENNNEHFLINRHVYTKIYKNLNKIIPYRNGIFFDDLIIKETNVDVTNLNPVALEQIYKLKPYYVEEVDLDLNWNIDKDHPFIETFKKHTDLFYSYLLEYQMILNEKIIEKIKQYLWNYLINYINKQSKNKIDNITYYLTNYEHNYQVVYEKKSNKNKITFAKNLYKEYYNNQRIEYKFPYKIIFNKVNLKKEINVSDILKFTTQIYGAVLNFGNDRYFEVPYMDFLDDYSIFKYNE